MGDCVYPGKSFREDPSSPPANPIPFRPCFPHPPAGTNGTTPCGVGNALRPEPGVVRRPAQPRAVWHNVVDVGEGKSVGAWGLSHLPRGLENISRRGWGAERTHLEPLRLSLSARYLPFGEQFPCKPLWRRVGMPRFDAGNSNPTLNLFRIPTTGHQPGRLGAVIVRDKFQWDCRR